MAELTCLNCNGPAEETYDLLVRGNQHEGTPLCEACYEALQREVPLGD